MCVTKDECEAAARPLHSAPTLRQGAESTFMETELVPRPRSRNGYWSRRIRRNAVIALGSALAAAILYVPVRDSPSPVYAWSLVTGYVSVGLIAIALMIGPWWVARGRPVP